MRASNPHAMSVGDELLKADRIFLNVGGRAVAPDMPGSTDIHYLTNVEMVDSIFARASGHHRGQLRRAGVRPDVPPIWRRVTDHRDGAAADIARGRRRLGGRQGDPGSRRHRRCVNAKGIQFRKRRQRISAVSLRAGRRRASTERTCCVAVGRRPNTDDLGLDKAGVRNRRAGTSWSTISSGPTSRTSGPWATAMAAARSPTPPTTIRDCGGQPARQRAAQRQRPHSCLRALHRPAARPCGQTERRSANPGGRR